MNALKDANGMVYHVNCIDEDDRDYMLEVEADENDICNECGVNFDDNDTTLTEVDEEG